MDRRFAWLRLAALSLTIATVAVAVVLAVGYDRRDLRATVEDVGGVPAFVALSAALTCALFPFPVLCAVAGLLYGVAEGTALAMAGTMLGALAAFGLARAGGAGPVEALATPRARRLLERVGERGFATVLLLRALPGVPRQPVNYLLGLTPVRTVDYTAATVLGTLPRAFAYTALGGSLTDLDSPQAIVAVVVLVALALVSLWLLRRSGSGTATSSPGDRSAGRP